MNSLLYIGIAQTVFAGILILVKDNKKLSDRILAALMFTISLAFITELASNLSSGSMIYHTNLQSAFGFIYGPLLYLYTKSLTDKDFQIRKYSYLHLFPFVYAYMIILLSIAFPNDLTNKILYIHTNKPPNTSQFFHLGFILISMSVYLYMTVKTLAIHENNIKDYYSYSPEKLNLKWLKIAVSFFVFPFIITIAFGLINYFDPLVNIKPNVFIQAGMILFAYAFSFFGFKQPQIFNENLSLKNGIAKLPGEKEISNGSDQINKINDSYKNSSLSEEDSKLYLQKLNTYIEENKPHLNRDLNINDLAKNLDMPRHVLTQLLNEKMGMNFYTFINKLRVNEVISMMNNSKYDHYTLLAIAYDSGFNSKTAFNSAFKKETGKTPSEYRKNTEKKNDK